MATFLDTLSNRQDKEYYLKQGFTYKIDIDTSLLILAANQQREQTFDKEINSIDQSVLFGKLLFVFNFYF